MKKIMISLGLVCLAIMHPASAQAHVLITDTTKAKGAVLHVSPDDDPIAGQTASFFFDMQGQEIPYKEDAVRLLIIDAKGTQSDVNVTVNGTLATTEYTFPTQGAYKLVFEAVSEGSTYVFEHTQRISRGIKGDDIRTNSYAWAEIALLSSGLGILVFVIVVTNRRRAIAAQSRF